MIQSLTFKIYQMKILFPCATYYPAALGGPNTTLLWHSTYLKENDLEPIIITSDHGISAGTKLKRGEWIDTTYGKVIYHQEKHFGFPLKTVWSSLKTLKKIDVIHLNGMLNRVSLFLVFIVVWGNKPIIISPRGELFNAANKRKTFIKKVVFWFYSLIKNKVSFHATAKSEEQLIKEYFGEVKVEIQPNFIKATYLDKNVNSQKDFLFLGRINPIKNIHLLIEAASKSKLFMKSTSKIILAGEARLEYEINYLDELKFLISKLGIQEKVVFKGHIAGEFKEKLLNQSYFLVLPSESENFGNVVLESLMAGTPVIASLGTPWESLNDNRAGYWVESTLESLIDVLNKALVMTESDYIEYSNNAKKLVRSSFDIESPANKWVEIYKKMAP